MFRVVDGRATRQLLAALTKRRANNIWAETCWGNWLIVACAEQNILNVAPSVCWILGPHTTLGQAILVGKVEWLFCPVTVETRSHLWTKNIVGRNNLGEQGHQWSSLLNHAKAWLKERHSYYYSRSHLTELCD